MNKYRIIYPVSRYININNDDKYIKDIDLKKYSKYKYLKYNIYIQCKFHFYHVGQYSVIIRYNNKDIRLLFNIKNREPVSYIEYINKSNYDIDCLIPSFKKDKIDDKILTFIFQKLKYTHDRYYYSFCRTIFNHNLNFNKNLRKYKKYVGGY